MSRAEIVRVDAVTKDVRPGFGLRRKRVLDDDQFCVREGEIFGFVGPNGAGKTTMLKLLLGLIRATSGSRARARPRRRARRRSAATSGSCPRTPTSTTISPGARRSTSTRSCAAFRASRRRERGEELLAQVGLAHAANARVRTYSKGMQQRLGIAQALVHDPDVVFLDEPMSGLDPIGRKEVRDLILRLRDQGKTVFMNTHILHDVELVCDRVAIIAGGRIRYEGAIQDFVAAGERVTDLLVASVPAHLAALLEERFAAQLRGVGDRIEVRVAEKDVDAALAVLLEAGASVLSVSPHRASLEQIFLSAVEESRR